MKISEQILAEYSEVKNIQYLKYEQINYIYHDKFKFYLESFFGIILLILYVFISLINNEKVLFTPIIIFLLVSLLLVFSAIKKRKNNNIYLSNINVKNSNGIIEWKDIVKIQRILINPYKYEILRLIGKNCVLDINISELNYKKEKTIDIILNYWYFLNLKN